jgi:transcription-repair coupling factor (superfamily II helicase)
MASNDRHDGRPGPVLDPALLDGVAGFEELARTLVAGGHTESGGLWGSSQAFLLAALMRRVHGPWIVVCSKEDEADAFALDLAAFGVEAASFPARETGGRTASGDLDSIRGRLQVAQRLAGPPERRPQVLVASLLSMLQPVPSPEEIAGDFLHLATGQKLDLEDLLERLVGAGFARQPLAERRGEVSLRGDILDVFPFAAELPLRVELFGQEIESLRTFDPSDQRSVESTKRASLCLARDAGDVEDGRGTHPANLLSPTSVWVDVEPLRLEDRTEGLRLQSSSHARSLDTLRRARAKARRLSLQSLPSRGVNFPVKSVQGLARGIHEAAESLRGAGLDGTRVRVLCQNEAEEHRFRAALEEASPGSSGSIETGRGSVERGFRFPEPAVVLVNHRELLGLEAVHRSTPTRPVHRARALASFFELKLGDLVVHAVHGLARYAGLVRMERNGGEEEHLHLLFKDEVSLFVPVSRIDLVQRYVGSGGSQSPPLDKIGSQSFRKRKEKVGRALADLAAELLEIHARRELQRRDGWREDDDLVREMIASFPWADTTDQVAADREIAEDLAGPRAMDRLLCGDVGFGKTELAVRAAFRVVSGGGQVAVLVPTTVLAAQHEATFRERLADFPVTVESLSRYRTGKAAKEVVERTRKGEVDILIGTHRVLSKDVGFANLGLVIIDEEQRFGVTHKEHFKRLRASVDLLTLSATPIPRTLHMSLSGVRDISALTVPPEGRQEIETRLVFAQDRELVREVLLREKNRGGQVFFLHNRVSSIRRVAEELRQLVPECSYLVGHGQMGGAELKRVMDAFSRGEADVLVATTIIENGIDIPAAGTIVVDRADMYGLSELHQLRGRVGRGRHKAYCYLLLDETVPLSDVARKRLKALEEMNQLGAGFNISMRDLEIRGAGNILGPEQSGHILAVGYDMYCRLLKQTVASMRTSGATGVDAAAIASSDEVSGGVELALGLRAFLPAEWIGDADTRIELLRALDAIRTDEDLADATAMLRDRFGRPPVEARNLLRQFRLKALLAEAGVRRLTWHGTHYALEFRDRVALETLFAGSRAEIRPIETGRVHVQLPEPPPDAEGALAWFERQLKTPDGSPTMRLEKALPR